MTTFASILIHLLFSHLWGNAALTNEEALIVFLQAEDQFFSQEVLPQLEAYSSKQGIQLKVRKAQDGIPTEITSTPAIVFFGRRGKAVYASRYAEFSTIENFIRSSRVAPQLSASNCRESVLSWQEGRTTIIAPLKLTNLVGEQPTSFDRVEFSIALQKGIERGASSFAQVSEACLERTDRAFYLDVHPFVGDQEQLYLSYAIFSQFDCVVPMAESLQMPLTAPWSKRDSLFQELGNLFEGVVKETLSGSTIGDAVTPIDQATSTVDWNSIYQIPISAQDNAPTLDPESLGPLPTKWTFAGPIAPELPAIQFQFQAPLDRYAGEVTKVEGGLQLGSDRSLQGGSFKVNTASLTMGMPGLDTKVHKKYIKIKRFPEASFQFSKLELANPLQWGVVTRLAIPGEFQLMQYRRPVKITAELRPSIDEAGQAIIIVYAQFQLNITDNFGIDGPDGPDPARKTMLFNLNFLLREQV